MSNFGQRVKIEVFDTSKTNLVFSSEELRVDFDIKQMLGINTARFIIYNLNLATSSNLVNGDRFVTVSVSLHGQEYTKIADKMFVANGYVETKVPNKLTYLYCYDLVNKENLSKQLNSTTGGMQTLEELLNTVSSWAGYEGKPRLAGFPDAVKSYKPPRKYHMSFNSSFESVMKVLAKAYGFDYFILDNKIVCQYIHSADTVKGSYLDDPNILGIVLDSNNMRSNPKIGASTLQITSNLDTRIRPTEVLDISDLITASVDINDDNLTLVEDLIRNVVTGFKRFVCLEARHTGSNYTSDWKTVATGVSPRKGTRMSTANWGIR